MTKRKARTFKCAALRQRDSWIEPAYVTVDGDGIITEISDDEPAGKVDEDIRGLVIPGFQNAHSHAFQYAMVGFAEHLSPDAQSDDFWSWREAMYRLAGSVSPEHVEAIAAMLYAEMLRFGVTAVAEFHYLHHQPGGKAYANVAELGERLMAAAERTGIHLTLVPVLYQRGGFGKKASPAQSRFLSKDLNAYQKLIDATHKVGKGRADILVGCGVHSLRAADPEAAKELFASKFAGPMHLHIAEQQREVDDCKEHLGKRPVAWLLDNAPVDERFNCVHATHVDAKELKALATSGATAVICPSTEGNLGDGFFPLKDYLGLGGSVAIGSDSQVTLNPLEELRWLDYGQRLRLEKRNVLCSKGGDDSGARIFDQAWTSGRRAMGLSAKEYFAVGQPFDAVILDPAHPVLSMRPNERRLSALIYGGDPSCFLGTMRRGRWLVKNQRHVGDEDFRTQFASTLASLLR